VNAVLLDTHAWTWSLTGDERLSPAAASAITGADSVWVSPISFFEIGQKVRIGKWPEMVPYIDDLPQLLQEQGGRVAQMTPDIALQASVMIRLIASLR
jgi:PIN domain nuclease of toxin-antitoxin system